MAHFKTKPTEVETFYQYIFVDYPDDYLCIEEQRFKFPCRPEVFAKTYEPMAE